MRANKFKEMDNNYKRSNLNGRRKKFKKKYLCIKKKKMSNKDNFNKIKKFKPIRQR